MKTLAVFLSACLILIALLAWRFGATPTPPPAPEAREAPRLNPPASSAPTEPEAQARVSPPVPRTQPVSGAPPPPTKPATHWAGQGERGRLEQRLRAARQALRDDPYNHDARRDLVDALRRLEQWEDFKDALARWAELEPKNAARRFEYATALMRLREWSAAIVELQVVVALEPDHTRGWYNLAVAQQAVGHLGDARRSWDRTIELAPDDVEARARRGEVLLDQKDWAAAATDFAELLRRSPGAIDAALNLSLALWNLDRLDDARRVVARVLSENPRHVPAINRLAELTWAAYESEAAADASLRDEALALWRRSLTVDADQADVRARLTEVEQAP